MPWAASRTSWRASSTSATPGSHHPEVEARALLLKQKAVEAITLLPQAPAELANSIQAIESPAALADTIASFLDIKPTEKQELLETAEIRERLERVSTHLTRRVEVLKLSRQIEEQTKEAIDDRQREYVLREQLKQIQKELGEETEGRGSRRSWPKPSTKAGMPPEVDEHARKELKRLERMNEASGEYSMARTYLDSLIALPWSKLDAEVDRHRSARRGILDEDHYGLEKIKKRILEYLAVRKLNPEGRSPILCFVGPPGRGQDFARPVDRARARPQVRAHQPRRHARRGRDPRPSAHLHRRAAGQHHPGDPQGRHAQPGADARRDRQARRTASTAIRRRRCSRCSTRSRTRRSATTTSACRSTCRRCCSSRRPTSSTRFPGPLRDRMEIIELTGYTEEEKVEIARRYLVRRQLEANGLKQEQASISDEALHVIARDYTREAGCRNLERDIGAVLRNVAVRVAEGKATSVRIDADDVQEILGAPRFENEVAMRVSVPGVATGLAWTPVGGDILFIEATRMPGSGKLILTGPARRRDEGERAGGAEPAQVAGRVARHRFDALREERHPRARAGRRDPEGRSERRRHDVHGAGVAADRARRCATTSR